VIYSDFSLISFLFKSNNQQTVFKGIYNTQQDFPKIGKNKLVLL